jgi:hypothetical protein
VPPPGEGHEFQVSVTSRGYSSVVGVPGSGRLDDWVSEPVTVTVRAWDLPAALRLAAEVSLGDWFEDDGLSREQFMARFEKIGPDEPVVGPRTDGERADARATLEQMAAVVERSEDERVADFEAWLDNLDPAAATAVEALLEAGWRLVPPAQPSG